MQISIRKDDTMAVHPAWRRTAPGLSETVAGGGAGPAIHASTDIAVIRADAPARELHAVETIPPAFAAGHGPAVPAVPRSRLRLRCAVAGALVWAVVSGNVVVLVWLWVYGGNLEIHSGGDLLTSIGRLTGLLGAYSALVQVILLSRLPWLERLYGLGRLSIWHRWNGHACLYLVLAHVVFTVYGYALLDKISLPQEISTMLGGGIYPGMVTATIGTALLIAVVVSSIVIVRRHLPYELWHLVHLTAYAGIALAWFHQIPTGNEFVLNKVAADYWRALHIATLAILVLFRVVGPVVSSLRFRLRVTEVVAEGPDVVSLRITGRRLDRLGARAGQFFLWRFLDRRRWWSAHPFLLSAAPDGKSLRITVKALGDHSSLIGEIALGTRVVTEGPFGVFTDLKRGHDKVVLIAGGIAPVRALLEEMGGDIVVLYRVVSDRDILFSGELDRLARERGARLHYVVGDHAIPAGAGLLSPGHLRELVPDIAQRDVYVCGPPAMIECVVRSARGAAVPRSHIHVEGLAL